MSGYARQTYVCINANAIFSSTLINYPMRTFPLLLFDWIRQFLCLLICPAPRISIPFDVSAAKWFRLLNDKLTAKQRIYLAGIMLALFLPFTASAQLITIATPQSVCAGQSLSLTVTPALGVNLSLLSLSIASPTGITATVGAGNSLIGVNTSATLTTGVRNLTVTVAGVPLQVPISVQGLPVLTSSLPSSVSAGASLSLGTCSLGAAVSYTLLSGNTGTGNLTLTPALAGQSIRVGCIGGCSSSPVTLVLPAITGSLAINAPTAVCVGVPVSLTLLPTGFSLNQAGLVITASTPSGALTVGALGPDGVLTVSGSNLTVGTAVPITVTATLNGVPLASATVNLNVLAQPAAPTQPVTLTATVGSSFSLTAEALCPVGTQLTLGSLTGSGSILIPTVTTGVQNLTVLCTNGTCLSTPTPVSITVVVGNQAPVLTGVSITSPQTATVSAAYSTTTAAAFRDPDGGTLTYSAGPLPSGISINASTGVISGVASTTVGSPFSVTVTATDPQGASVKAGYVLNVVNRATAPTACGSSNLDGSDLRATMPIYECGQITTSGEIRFTATGGNANGGPVEYLAIGVTNWTTNCNLIIDRETRTDCHADPIEIRVRQLLNGSYVYGWSFIFRIRAQCPVAGCPPAQANRAPVVKAGIPDQQAWVGEQLIFDVPPGTFVDPDGDALLFTSSKLPESFNFSSGRLSGVPKVAETIRVTITVYDNGGGSASTSFNLVVNPSRRARIASPKAAEVPLDVRVLGNPTQEDVVSVEIRGAEGKPVHIMMVDAQGRTVSKHTVENANAVEHQNIRLGRTVGMYLLRVSMGLQLKTVKVIKQ